MARPALRLLIVTLVSGAVAAAVAVAVLWFLAPWTLASMAPNDRLATRVAVSALGRGFPGEDVEQAWRERLASDPARAATLLARHLDSGDDLVRHAAGAELARIAEAEDPSLLAHLVPLLDDPYDEIRWLAFGPLDRHVLDLPPDALERAQERIAAARLAFGRTAYLTPTWPQSDLATGRWHQGFLLSEVEDLRASWGGRWKPVVLGSLELRLPLEAGTVVEGRVDGPLDVLLVRNGSDIIQVGSIGIAGGIGAHIPFGDGLKPVLATGAIDWEAAAAGEADELAPWLILQERMEARQVKIHRGDHANVIFILRRDATFISIQAWAPDDSQHVTLFVHTSGKHAWARHRAWMTAEALAAGLRFTDRPADPDTLAADHQAIGALVAGME